MFDGKRYATSGITAKIPNFMQNLLWFLIKTMDVESKLRILYINRSSRHTGKNI